jgi:hypothetical protein
MLTIEHQSSQNLWTSISAGNAVLSLLHEIPDCDLELDKVTLQINQPHMHQVRMSSEGFYLHLFTSHPVMSSRR